MEYDVIVVGAGAAGCVVAARLSERPDCRVLLVEAGEDIVPEPPSIRSPYPISHAVRAFRWPGLVARIKAPRDGGGDEPSAPYLQARLMGGGGSLMGMIALRGLPQDYDGWEAEGAAGWGWDDVMPHFNRLERDLDFGGALHGADGPIPIRRHARESWSPFARTVGDAFEADGFPFIADANGDFGDGHIAVPSSSWPDRRVSSATGLLDAAARSRPNLTILTGAEVASIRIEGRRTTGVVLAAPEEAVITGQRIIVCAGAIKTPLLLLQSGVGPASDLARAGVMPVHDLPGVGRNLCNHPAIYLSALLPRAARQGGGPFITNALRYSSGIADCPAHDMLMPVINRTAWHALGHRISALGACVYKSLSGGRISVSRAGGQLVPDIDLGLFADGRDLDRMVDGFRRIHRYLTAASARLPGLTIFAPTNMKMTARLAEPGTANRAIAWAASASLDGPSYARRRALLKAGVDPAPLLRDDAALADFVYRHSAPMYHPAGTCRIGAASDPLAVVDPRCRVIGIDGLSIADASVMPAIVRGNTNLPTMMIGEKAAAMIRADAVRP